MKFLFLLNLSIQKKLNSRLSATERVLSALQFYDKGWVWFPEILQFDWADLRFLYFFNELLSFSYRLVNQIIVILLELKILLFWVLFPCEQTSCFKHDQNKATEEQSNKQGNHLIEQKRRIF